MFILCVSVVLKVHIMVTIHSRLTSMHILLLSSHNPPLALYKLDEDSRGNYAQ